MSIPMRAMNENLLPQERMRCLEVAEKLDPRLMAILLEEIAGGNRIDEAREGDSNEFGPGDHWVDPWVWPGMKAGEILVSLEEPFGRAYPRPEGVAFFPERPGTHDAEGPRYETNAPRHHVLCAPG